MNITHLEEDIAKEIINIGLGKAADSMAFFVKEKIFIRTTEVSLSGFFRKDLLSSAKEDKDLLVLSTAVKGDLNGLCYLIFTKEEVDALIKVALPNVSKKSKDGQLTMIDAFMRELDNIVSASVISQFANLFNYKMYGDVPESFPMNQSLLQKFIEIEAKDESFVIYFRSEFKTENLSIEPEFLWCLDQKYIEGVREVALDSNALQRLRTE